MLARLGDCPSPGTVQISHQEVPASETSQAQSPSRRCTNNEWITHRSMRMIVIAHHGANGMKTKLTTIERHAMRIPSKRAQAAPEKDPETGREPDDSTDQVDPSPGSGARRDPIALI